MEVIVVVAIVALLFAILLPAVGRVRETARRSVCMNNLAQLGIAIQSYHDVFGVLPPAYVTKIGGDAIMGAPDPRTRDTGPGWGFLAQLLPAVEQGPLYAALNMNLPCWDVANSTAATTVVATYLCPSALEGPSTFPVMDGKGTTLATFARSHYVANAGRVNAWDVGVDDLTTVPGVDGPFFRNSGVRLADIPDGTSLTVFAGERMPSVGDATWVGVVPGAQVCSKLAGANAIPCRGSGALVGAHSGPSSYEKPQEIHVPSGSSSCADQMASHHFGGGGNVLMGDGSVRYYTGTMKSEVWAAICTRDGGEMVPTGDW
jgi:prepilin-type processing-associated H-X9-DG protein